MFALGIGSSCSKYLLCTNLWLVLKYFQALNLPQLRRDQGHLIYLLSTGHFSLHKARGLIVNARVVELREARAAGHTGPLDIYNFLASQLPQDTTVFFQRLTFF